MQRIERIIIVVLLIALMWVWNANAGTPAAPGTAPGSTNWYTLETIYNRLNAGTTGSPSAFTEPSVAPGTGTMYTLNEVMDKAPAADNTNGAVPGEVLSGKTYWSLRTDGSGSSKWGVLTGTLPTQTLADSTTNIKAGYYTTTTLESVDSDFVNTNIKSGVNIFGITGTVIEATGDATAADVLSGKTFSKAGSANLTGTMVNHGSKSYTPSASEQTITAGYYDGTGKVNTDSDLTAGNIKKDVDIFGVTGNVIEATGTVTASYVLDDSTFSNATSAGLTGSMTNNGAQIYTPSTVTQTVAAGYHNGEGKVKGDPDLVAKKIGKGFEIFGVTGTFTTTPNLALVPKTGLTKCYDASNNEVTCPATDRLGQDGEYQKGVELPNPRFTNNSDGTVTDNFTGLIWLKNANCADAKRDWATALSDVTQLNTNGQMNGNDCGDISNSGSHQTDWRLPNVRELQSLVHYGFSRPPLSNTAGTAKWSEGDPFTGVQSNSYWTSSTSSDNASNGWRVHLIHGGAGGSVAKSDALYVWPVRGGE